MPLLGRHGRFPVRVAGRATARFWTSWRSRITTCSRAALKPACARKIALTARVLREPKIQDRNSSFVSRAGSGSQQAAHRAVQQAPCAKVREGRNVVSTPGSTGRKLAWHSATAMLPQHSATAQRHKRIRNGRNIMRLMRTSIMRVLMAMVGASLSGSMAGRAQPMRCLPRLHRQLLRLRQRPHPARPRPPRPRPPAGSARRHGAGACWRVLGGTDDTREGFLRAMPARATVSRCRCFTLTPPKSPTRPTKDTATRRVSTAAALDWRRLPGKGSAAAGDARQLVGSWSLCQAWLGKRLPTEHEWGKRRAALMGAAIRGAMSGTARAPWRVTKCNLSAPKKAALRPMARSTWRAMCLNGSTTGIRATPNSRAEQKMHFGTQYKVLRGGGIGNSQTDVTTYHRGILAAAGT